MKAISPVIATLILIAIAVIAGVFVLRQFILLSTTSGNQNMLQIQDVTFYRTVRAVGPDQFNMTVTLQFNVKNIGTRQLTLLEVRVPDANNFNKTLSVRLNPGQTYTDTVTVLDNVEYNANWDSGTEHLVIFVYQVQGQPTNQTVSQKGTVQ